MSTSTKGKSEKLAQNSGKTAKAARGRPFAKGDDVRRNKGGRPRMSADMRIAFASLCPYAIDRLKRLILHGDDVIALKAVQIALDRALGTVDETGAIYSIEAATVETGEVMTVFEQMENTLVHKRIPDEELKERAQEAVDAALEDIARRESGEEVNPFEDMLEDGMK